MTILLVLLGSYLLGSLPIGLFVGHVVQGIDIRKFGSGNTGASNVGRVLGLKWGIVVFILDVSKGLLPVLFAVHTHVWPAWLPVLAGLATIIGHNCSLFLKFKGGKGVATSLGVAFGMSWVAGLIGFGIWGVALAITRYISLASIIAVPICSFLIWWLTGRELSYGLFGILASVFAIVKHRSNIARLKGGTEPKVEFKKKKTLE